MCFDQLIQLITSSATLITALLVLFTLFEMIKQRRSSYKPELISRDFNYYVYWVKYSNDSTPLTWSNIELKDTDTVKETQSLYLELFNIGLGSAKDISFRWCFDADNIIRKISLLDKLNNYNITYHKNKSLLIESSGNPESHSYYSIESIDNSVAFILPSNIVNKPTKLAIPHWIIALHSIYLLLIKDLNDDLIEPSKLSLTIDYKDIGNKYVHKTLNINFNIHMFTPVDRESAFLTTMIGRVNLS